MLRVEVITELSLGDKFVEEWHELTQQCNTATIFQTPDWLVTWWQRLGRSSGKTAYILSVREDLDTGNSRLVGLLPLVKSNWYALPMRRLSFMGAGVSDYGDLIAARGFETPVCDALSKFLVDDQEWDVIDLSQLRQEGLFTNCLPNLHGSFNIRDFQLENCPYIELDTSVPPANRWEALLKTYSKKQRSAISYNERTLRRAFEVKLWTVDDEAQLEAAYAALFDLHERRWNQRWLPGAFSNRKTQEFHLAAGRSLLKSGYLRLHAVSLDDQIEAVLYAFAFNDRTCYYQGGFEPDLAKYSLGSILIARAIEQSAKEGFPIFDFLRGNEAYKLRWTKGVFKTNTRIVITRDGTLSDKIASWLPNTELRFELWAKSIVADGIVNRPVRALQYDVNSSETP